MNALGVGLAMQGQYNVNIDGMKSQLEAEKAAAEQAVAQRKARDKETSDVLKSATDFLGTSKIAPMYKEPAMSLYQGTIQKMSSLVKDGSFGLEAHKELVKFKEALGHYVASSDEFYKSQNDLSPGVRDMFNDPKGLERAAQVSFENAQTSYFFGDKNEHQVVFPVKSKSPISDWKTSLNAQKIADTEPMKGTERTFTVPGTNNVQYEQKYGLNPVAQKQYVNQDVATLLNAQNISDTLKEYYGGLKPEYFENGPNNQGLVPTQAVVADITKMVNDGYSGRYEELKNFSGSIPREPAEKASTYDKAFLPPGQPWAQGGEKGFDYGQAGTTARKTQVTAPAGTKQRVNGKYQDYNGGKERLVEATPVGPVVINDGGQNVLKFRYNVPIGQGEVDQIYIGGTDKGFVDFTTHLGITSDEEELNLLLSGIGGLVGSNKEKIVDKYVKALAANGVKITFQTSAPAAAPTKPASSSAGAKKSAPDQSKWTKEQKVAYLWATSNPNDPRASKILSSLGIK